MVTKSRLLSWKIKSRFSGKLRSNLQKPKSRMLIMTILVSSKNENHAIFCALSDKNSLIRKLNKQPFTILNNKSYTQLTVIFLAHTSKTRK